MALARYTYLPWLRRGAANAILGPATAKSRAEVKVSLAVNDGTATGAPIEKTFLLMGPGDVVGISPDLIVRTEPKPWVTDFEPNYLPFVEFYDEDFLWRHTPAPADLAAHRLTPWLVLLVLAEGEFDRGKAVGRPLPSLVITAPDPQNLFPPPDQLWAWAHVQIVGDVGGTAAPDPDALRLRLQTSPDSGISRLVSPRRLQPNTAYTAFLVPSFEAGRKAGLGLAINDATEPGTAASWTADQTEFPIYFQWYFRTGEDGNFEELVQRMLPREIDKRVGVRDMDIAAPGFGMPLVSEAVGPGETPSHHEGVVGLEGALKSPTMTPKPLDERSQFPDEVARFVNAPAIARESAPGDPVVAPPLVGGWHALLDRVDPEERPAWPHELNTDPRSRAAAGLGARVVRKGQERYMKLAWEQVGEIIPANRKAAFLRFAQGAMHKSFKRNIAPLPTFEILSIASPMLSRVRGSPQTLRALVRDSSLPDAAVSPAFRKLVRPRGLVARRALPQGQRRSAASRFASALNAGRISAAPPSPPPGAATLETLADTVGKAHSDSLKFARLSWWVIAALILAACLLLLLAGGLLGFGLAAVCVAAAAGVYLSARRPRLIEASIAGLRLSDLTPDKVPDEAPTAFGLAAPGARPAAADPVSAKAFGEALRDFSNLTAARSVLAPRAGAFDEANAEAKMLAAIAPETAYPRRAASLIRIGDKSIIDYALGAYAGAPALAPDAPPEIKPVMAYPDIKEPMYLPLSEINDDLLAPNLGLIPPNTVSLMLTNPPFIEAYMAGINHEFARELLWREYPTDCRGSPFRQFWDVSRVPTPGLEGAERAKRLKDIRPLHEWPVPELLGSNPNPERGFSGEGVVLVLRGDLLKRYPNTIVYAQRARWSADSRYPNELSLFDEEGARALAGIDDENIEHPIFTAVVAPDLTFIGFKLKLNEVRGDHNLEETAAARISIPADRLGWFFVLQEALGEPRFGLDENAPPPAMESPIRWDNLSWDHIDLAGRQTIDLGKPFLASPNGVQPAEPLDWSPALGATAADVAAILYQKPVMVAWHARQMLAPGKV